VISASPRACRCRRRRNLGCKASSFRNDNSRVGIHPPHGRRFALVGSRIDCIRWALLSHRNSANQRQYNVRLDSHGYRSTDHRLRKSNSKARRRIGRRQSPRRRQHRPCNRRGCFPRRHCSQARCRARRRNPRCIAIGHPDRSSSKRRKRFDHRPARLSIHHRFDILAGCLRRRPRRRR
jgi:hypothetical protein